MTRVTWTDQALEDLAAIRAYIARDSVSAADHRVERLVLAMDLVQDHPLAGRVVPEFAQEEIRERIQGSYRVVYRLGDGVAEVLAVHHAARLLERFDPSSGSG